MEGEFGGVMLQSMYSSQMQRVRTRLPGRARRAGKSKIKHARARECLAAAAR